MVSERMLIQDSASEASLPAASPGCICLPGCSEALETMLSEDAVMHVMNYHLIKFLLMAKLAVFAAVFLHQALHNRKASR